MIPRKIHYCWFGGKQFPKLAEKCMKSWKRLCPDYEIVRWDETNSPLEDNEYVRQAYRAGKWAFVSDYVRLYALREEGGVYLDTDVELLRPLDEYLDSEAFMGFESAEKVATCVIGAKARHPVISELCAGYGDRWFQRPDGSFDETTNVAYITEWLAGEGLRRNGEEQTVRGVSVYPAECFSPKDLETGRLKITSNTAAIHHFQASWMSPRQRRHTYIAQKIGAKNTAAIKKILGR